MLQAQQIAYEIRGRALLQDISLSIVPGEVAVIVGANGAGKSTLLKVLSGDIDPQAGDVLLDGVSLHSFCPRTLARRRAVMPQHSPLNFPFRVEEVVEMGRAPFQNDVSSQRNQEIVERMMLDFEIEHLRNRDYTTLSGGEQQRVHLARVVSQIWEPHDGQARYLLLDEPASSLDIHHQYDVLQYLKRLSRQGVGIAVVLHDLNSASLFADRVVVLKRGCLMAEGHSKTVFQSSIVAEAFSFEAHITTHPVHDRPLIVPLIDAVPGMDAFSDVGIL